MKSFIEPRSAISQASSRSLCALSEPVRFPATNRNQARLRRPRPPRG